MGENDDEGKFLLDPQISNLFELSEEQKENLLKERDGRIKEETGILVDRLQLSESDAKAMRPQIEQTVDYMKSCRDNECLKGMVVGLSKQVNANHLETEKKVENLNAQYRDILFGTKFLNAAAEGQKNHERLRKRYGVLIKDINGIFKENGIKQKIELDGFDKEMINVNIEDDENGEDIRN